MHGRVELAHDHTSHWISLIRDIHPHPTGCKDVAKLIHSRVSLRAEPSDSLSHADNTHNYASLGRSAHQA